MPQATSRPGGPQSLPESGIDTEQALLGGGALLQGAAAPRRPATGIRGRFDVVHMAGTLMPPMPPMPPMFREFVRLEALSVARRWDSGIPPSCSLAVTARVAIPGHTCVSHAHGACLIRWSKV